MAKRTDVPSKIGEGISKGYSSPLDVSEEDTTGGAMSWTAAALGSETAEDEVSTAGASSSELSSSASSVSSDKLLKSRLHGQEPLRHDTAWFLAGLSTTRHDENVGFWTTNALATSSRSRQSSSANDDLKIIFLRSLSIKLSREPSG